MLPSGPYLNVRFDIPALADKVMDRVESEGSLYGTNQSGKGRKIMIEFSCPNTNKPLHLGHMRNDSLGQSVSELLKATGAEVMKVNLINNRGVHISKSMLAYKLFGNGETPESTGEKGDHFVGRYYVRFAAWEKEVADAKEKDPSIVSDPSFVDPDEAAQAMLRDWEAGDPEVRALWEKMNKWTLDGLFESYRNMGISFDKLYYESDTYRLGRGEVMRGLDLGVFKKEEDGSVQVDLAPIGLDKKVLLRRDGTTLYITQDIGTAVRRHEDWPFDSLIYVVASEQNYHFKVLFYVLGLLGYEWAEELHHLAYGMVNLPDGKMKSREGTVVDADDLMEEMISTARETSQELGKLDGLTKEEAENIARMVGLGALKYFLLKVDPRKNMTFNPKESIDFNGNTGPFIQYTYARICSVLRKAAEQGITLPAALPTDFEISEKEEGLIQLLANFASVVKEAGDTYSPALIANYTYDLVKEFNQFYHDYSILHEADERLKTFRLVLSANVAKVVKEGMALLGIEVPERM